MSTASDETTTQDAPADDAAPAVRLDARITGTVQGVGFRHFTTMRAREFGVVGWVRNEADGSVRLVAEGNEDDVKRLLDAVHDGPTAAQVRSVSTDWQEPTGDFDDFRVRR
jgi:acylphosphatase